MDTEKQRSKTGWSLRESLLSLALSRGGLTISSQELNAKYTDEELDYLDEKLEEWAFSETRLDFVKWMLAGNDPLKVLHHLKDEE